MISALQTIADWLHAYRAGGLQPVAAMQAWAQAVDAQDVAWIHRATLDDLLAQAVEVKGAKLLATTLDGADVATLRETMDKLKDKLKSAAIVLASVADGKVTLIAGVTADLTSKVKAGELVNAVAQQVGGKGGGRPDMAQAGGTQPENLPAALAGIKAWVEQRLEAGLFMEDS